VTAFYAALDDERYADAWDALSPDVRARFGGFEGWRDGYETTLSNVPQELNVSPTPAGATVEHLLVASDRTPCGAVERTFAVKWELVRADGAWLASSLSATKRSGREPAAACA
jgi:hypothetical protein